MTFPTIWLMTDTARVPDPRAAVAKLPRGAAVILRHYDARDRATLAAGLAALCRARGLVLLVAGAWRLAAMVGAQGLHLPEYLAHRGPAPGARLWLKHKRRLLTAAAHGPRGVLRARALHADAALLSPLFPTASHPQGNVLGLTRAAMMARGAGLPVIALGGVTPKHLGALKQRGFSGIAGIGFGLR
jgi:thiamine-phosphate pyrophosphorylase